MALTLDFSLLLVMLFAFIAGAACGFAYLLLNGAGAFIFAIVGTIAGDRNLGKAAPRRSKALLMIRGILYFGLCVAAVFLASSGLAGWAYASGIVGAFCLPIAFFKAIEY